MSAILIRRSRSSVATAPKIYPWAVLCSTCAAEGDGIQPRRLVRALPTFEEALAWALAHHAEHEATRCPTCRQLPEGSVSTRQEKALRRALTTLGVPGQRGPA